ncbi:MAG: hypothetical protein GKC04_09290 [Methanomicrobiales archaeon]|nr:hypothetical protein [Methanomicrobiales archaeon]
MDAAQRPAGAPAAAPDDGCEALATAVTRQFGWCRPYREACRSKGFVLGDLYDLIDAGDYAALPSLPSGLFKRTGGRYREMAHPWRYGRWLVSSSTSGNPSFRLATPQDRGCIRQAFLAAYEKIPDHDVLFFMTPDPGSLESFSRGIRVDGRQATMYAIEPIHAGLDRCANVFYLYRPDRDRSCQPALLPGFRQDDARFLRVLDEAEASGAVVVLAYSALFLRSALEACGDRTYDFGDRIIVATGGGGWSGRKAVSQAEPIDKPRFVADLVRVLGIRNPGRQILDIYSSVETGTAHSGYYNTALGDYVFDVNPGARLYAIAPETGEPAGNGETGIPRTISPFGAEGAAAAVVDQEDDSIRVLASNRDGSVRQFSGISRVPGAGIPGLSVWMEEDWDGCPLDLLEMVGRHAVSYLDFA